MILRTQMWIRWNEKLERYQYGKIIMQYIHLKSVFCEIKDFISLCSNALVFFCFVFFKFYSMRQILHAYS